MQYFYEEQLHRMECLSQESVSFFDVMGQLHDMLNPEVRRGGERGVACVGGGVLGSRSWH